MEVDTEAEHAAEPAVDVVAAEEAEVEHTDAPAAEFELVGEVQAVKDQRLAIDFGLDVEDMYSAEPDMESMSLNSIRVEDMMAEKLVEFSEQLKEEEAENAVVGVESSTPRPKKRKCMLTMSTLPDTSLTDPRSRTSSLQILSTPPQSPSPPPSSPKPTATTTAIPITTPLPTPIPQPIPTFTTAATTNVTTPTILIAAIRMPDFHFTGGTSSVRPSGQVDEVESLRA